MRRTPKQGVLHRELLSAVQALRAIRWLERKQRNQDTCCVTSNDKESLPRISAACTTNLGLDMNELNILPSLDARPSYVSVS